MLPLNTWKYKCFYIIFKDVVISIFPLTALAQPEIFLPVSQSHLAFL